MDLYFDSKSPNNFDGIKKYRMLKEQFNDNLNKGKIQEFYILNKEWYKTYKTWQKTLLGRSNENSKLDVLTLNDKIQNQPREIQNSSLGEIIEIKPFFPTYSSVYANNGRFYLDFYDESEASKIDKIFMLKDEIKNDSSKLKYISKDMWDYFYSIYKGGPQIKRYINVHELLQTKKRKLFLCTCTFFKTMRFFVMIRINGKFEFEKFSRQENVLYLSNGINSAQIKAFFIKTVFQKLKKVENCKIWKISNASEAGVMSFIKASTRQFNSTNQPDKRMPEPPELMQLIDLYPSYHSFTNNDILIIETYQDRSFFKLIEKKHFLNSRCSTCNAKDTLTLACYCKANWFCSIKCFRNFFERSHHICTQNSVDLISVGSTPGINQKLTEESLKGKVGIKNLGNTCYMNAALQCLSNVYELSLYFLSDETLNSLGKSNKKLVEQFSNVLKKLHYGKEKAISINNFRMTFGEKNSIFLGSNQEDSEEFLITLLDDLHEELNSQNDGSAGTKVKSSTTQECSPALASPNQNTTPMSNTTLPSKKYEYDNGEKELLSYFYNNQSIISDLFIGQFRSSVQCFKCSKVSHSFDIFLCLSLPIPIINEIFFTVYFVYFDLNKGILQIPITIESDLLILDLRNKLSQILNIHPMSFFICSVETKTIEKILNCLTPMNEVIPNESSQMDNQIFCYQFDSRLNIMDNKFFSKNEKSENSINNSTDNQTAYFMSQFKKMHLSELDTEPHETFYSQVDPSFLELYPTADIIIKGGDFSQVFQNIDNTLNGSSSSSKTIKKEAKQVLINTIASSLLVYSDENYGFNGDYLKVILNFSEYSGESNLFKELKRKDIGFQRMIFINIKWTIHYLAEYINKNFSMNKVKPEIRIVNVNKNKSFQPCLVCGNIDCCDCLLENVRGVNIVEDILKLYTKNKTAGINESSKRRIDNEYLYYDISQRKVTIARCDFELSLCYPKSKENQKILYNTSTISDNLMNSGTSSKAKGKIDIYDCLKRFSKRELLDENNSWYCSSCKSNQKAIKKIQINYSPEIIIIQLKRFKNGGNVKIDNFVDIPIENFELTNYNVKEKYNLIGIINHYGTVGFGHYTATCKNHYNEKWYKYDDSKVCEVDPQNIITNSAYILFYKKNTFNPEKAQELYNNKSKNIEEVKKIFKTFQINYLRNMDKDNLNKNNTDIINGNHVNNVDNNYKNQKK